MSVFSKLCLNGNQYEVKDEKARPVNTIAVMKNMTNLVKNDVIKTLGYNAINDGGSGLYLIKERTNEHVEDNALIHFVGEGLVAELLGKDEINVKVLGAKGDGITDDTLPIRIACENFKRVLFPEGNYLITEPISLNDNTELKGLSYRAASLKFDENGSLDFIGTSITSGGIQKRFLTIDSLELSSNYTSVRTNPFLKLVCCAYVKIQNSWIYGMGRQVLMWECFDSRVTNTDFEWGGSSEDSTISGLELRSTNGGDTSNPSYEYTNNIYFYGCRFESHPGTCIMATGENTNKIFFTSCKFESFNCLNQKCINITKANNIYFKSCMFGGDLGNTENNVYIDQVSDFEVEGFGEHMNPSGLSYSGKKLFYLCGSNKRVVKLNISNSGAYEIDEKTFGIDTWERGIYQEGDIQVNNASNKNIMITSRKKAFGVLSAGSTYTMDGNGIFSFCGVGNWGETGLKYMTVKNETTGMYNSIITEGSNYVYGILPVNKGDVVKIEKCEMATAYGDLYYNR